VRWLNQNARREATSNLRMIGKRRPGAIFRSTVGRGSWRAVAAWLANRRRRFARTRAPPVF